MVVDSRPRNNGSALVDNNVERVNLTMGLAVSARKDSSVLLKIRSAITLNCVTVVVLIRKAHRDDGVFDGECDLTLDIHEPISEYAIRSDAPAIIRIFKPSHHEKILSARTDHLIIIWNGNLFTPRRHHNAIIVAWIQRTFLNFLRVIHLARI